MGAFDSGELSAKVNDADADSTAALAVPIDPSYANIFSSSTVDQSLMQSSDFFPPPPPATTASQQLPQQPPSYTNFTDRAFHPTHQQQQASQAAQAAVQDPVHLRATTQLSPSYPQINTCGKKSPRCPFYFNRERKQSICYVLR